jgi:cell wall assembly regulator SMI1
VKEIWLKIENWLSKNAPNVLLSLADGATDKEISDAETIMAIKFPEDFKASCKIHNGQKPKANTGFINGWNFLSLKEIIAEWEECLDSYDLDLPTRPDAGIKNGWFNKKWLPFTYDGDSNSHCLDLDPDQNGNYGQVVMVWHDDALRTLEARNFSEFLTAFSDSLENGGYLVDQKYGLSLN